MVSRNKLRLVGNVAFNGGKTSPFQKLLCGQKLGLTANVCFALNLVFKEYFSIRGTQAVSRYLYWRQKLRLTANASFTLRSGFREKLVPVEGNKPFPETFTGSEATVHGKC